MRPTTGTDVLATVVVLGGIGNPYGDALVILTVFVGAPLYVAGMALRAWRFHRRGIARVRAYEARLAR